MIVEAVPNFSAGRDERVIAEIAAVAAKGSHLLDVDADAIHNRSVVTVAAASLERLEDALFETVGVAKARIDLREHAGVHPRVGVADVIPFVPLSGVAMEECVAAAHRLGERIWRELAIPVYFYGEAARRPGSRRLSQIRAGADAPDLGDSLHESAGAVSIGARPPLVAYNLLLLHADSTAAARLASGIRESSGGMAGVQALAFDLGGDVLQLSMNLYQLESATPAAVLARARELGAQLGLEIGGEEVVGLCPAQAADSEAARGHLLEARLAAAAAHAGAGRCRDTGKAELELLAARLDSRADSLAKLGSDGDGLLRGAEEAAALPRVLERAGVLDSEVAGLFDYSARRLREAIGEPVPTELAARLEALDRWLATPPPSA
ncbi:MAG TPA: glutamate formiminotransferase [Candidatus Dormibacteraeota bacterium]